MRKRQKAQEDKESRITGNKIEQAFVRSVLAQRAEPEPKAQFSSIGPFRFAVIPEPGNVLELLLGSNDTGKLPELDVLSKILGTVRAARRRERRLGRMVVDMGATFEACVERWVETGNTELIRSIANRRLADVCQTALLFMEPAVEEMRAYHEKEGRLPDRLTYDSSMLVDFAQTLETIGMFKALAYLAIFERHVAEKRKRLQRQRRARREQGKTRLDVSRRDKMIKQDFDEIKAKSKRPDTEVRRILAKRYNLSDATIRLAVEGRATRDRVRLTRKAK